MKKKLLLVLTVIFAINTYSQISFERGYFINNSNQKTECFIKNIDWKNNPTSIDYKVSENSERKKITINDIKEFGVHNESKFIRRLVGIDRSPSRTNELNSDRRPELNKELLFLKVILEGKASLYVYEEGNLTRYFYNKEDSNITQLIYKKYLVSPNKAGTNKRYKQQLLSNLKCQKIKKENIESLQYKKYSLLNYFLAFNKCNNVKFITYGKLKRRTKFNLSIRPRLNSSSLTVENKSSNFNVMNMGSKINFGLGIEAEFVLPFNKNKWAIIIEPTYQMYKSNLTINSNIVSGGELTTRVKYNRIEVPFGFRHYFFLNDKHKLFTNISYSFDINLNSNVEFLRSDNSTYKKLDIKTNNYLTLGLGYKPNNTYSIEMRYHLNRNIVLDDGFWRSNFKTFSLIFSYSFL